MTIWHMHIACWITKATNTHPQYVIRIAFPLQQGLKENAPMSRYMYTARLLMTTLYEDLDSFLYASSVSLPTDLLWQKLSFTQQAVWKTGTHY